MDTNIHQHLCNDNVLKCRTHVWTKFNAIIVKAMTCIELYKIQTQIIKYISYVLCIPWLHLIKIDLNQQRI